MDGVVPASRAGSTSCYELPVPPTTDLLLAVIAMCAGAAVQGAVGFGSNLVAAPLLILLDTRFVPAPLIIMSLLLNTLTSRRETAVVDRQELLPALVGLLPGTALGVVLLRTADESALSLLFAATVLIAVGLVASGLHLKPRSPACRSRGCCRG